MLLVSLFRLGIWTVWSLCLKEGSRNFFSPVNSKNRIEFQREGCEPGVISYPSFRFLRILVNLISFYVRNMFWDCFKTLHLNDIFSGLKWVLNRAELHTNSSDAFSFLENIWFLIHWRPNLVIGKYPETLGIFFLTHFMLHPEWFLMKI